MRALKMSTRRMKRMFKISYSRAKGVVTEKVRHVEEEGKIFQVKNKKQIEVTLDKMVVNKSIKSGEVGGMIARVPVVESVVVFTNDPKLISHWEKSLAHEYIAEMDLIAREVVKNFF